MFGLTPLELAVFLVFIAEYPFARFFFGIPAWAIGVVIVGIQLLQYIGLRDQDGLILLVVTIAVAALTARAMGLAQSLPWIPKIPIPAVGSRRKKKGRRTRGTQGEVVSGPWSAPPAASRIGGPRSPSRRRRPTTSTTRPSSTTCWTRSRPAAWTASPPTRSAASTSSPSASATVAERVRRGRFPTIR